MNVMCEKCKNKNGVYCQVCMFNYSSLYELDTNAICCDNCKHYRPPEAYWDNENCRIGGIPDCPDNGYIGFEPKHPNNKGGDN